MFANLLLEGARVEEEKSGAAPQDIPVLIARLTEAEAIKLEAEIMELAPELTKAI